MSVAPMELIERDGTTYTRAIHEATGERIWVEVHSDGTLTAANGSFSGAFDHGDAVTLLGDETADTWGTFRAAKVSDR
ncbi:hypothetical protein LCGC14_2928270 [marine sediment metagenome]|uniref:Uncharacterized protein n=1 Tax=marine sediment metagenome TaxID=412755 RepID=A0A0F8XLR6_9ZZZZ